MLLRELAAVANSTRLSNALLNFAGTVHFPYMTVSECFVDTKTCLETFRKLPNVGDKTKKEFAQLLRSCIDAWTNPQTGARETMLLNSPLDDLIRRGELPQMSVRLKNILLKNVKDLSFHTFRECIVNPRASAEELATCRGVGITTKTEFLRLIFSLQIPSRTSEPDTCVWAINVIGDCDLILPCPAMTIDLRIEERSTLSSASRMCSNTTHLIDELKRETHNSHIISAVEHSIGTPGLKKGDLIRHLASVDALIVHCDPHIERMIVKSGFGSLQSILEQVEITLSQILSPTKLNNWLSKIQNAPDNLNDTQLANNLDEQITDALYNAGLLYAPQLMYSRIKQTALDSYKPRSVLTIESFRRKVDWRLVVLLQYTYGVLEKGLDRHFVRIGECWVEDSERATVVAEQVNKLHDYLIDKQTPIPIETVAREISLTQTNAESALAVSSRFSCIGGYVVPKLLGARAFSEDLSTLLSSIPAINPIICSFLSRQKISKLKNAIPLDENLLSLKVRLLSEVPSNKNIRALPQWIANAVEITLEHLEKNALSLFSDKSNVCSARRAVFGNCLETLLGKFKETVVSVLGEDRLEIAEERFGAPRISMKTLDRIALDLELSRERVRQLERRIPTAYNDCGFGSFTEAFSDPLRSAFIASLPHDSDLCDAATLDNIEFPWELLALIRCEYGSEHQLMDSVFPAIGKYWYIGHKPFDLVDQARKLVDQANRKYRFPMEISFLSSMLGISTELLKLAAKANKHVRIQGDLVFIVSNTTLYSAQKSSAIYTGLKKDLDVLLHKRPHQIASDIPKSDGSFSARDIGRFLTKIEPAVINMFENQWTTATVLDSPADKCSCTESQVTKRRIKLGNLEKSIHDILQEKGPMHLSEIREAITVDSGICFSESSFGPVLLTSPYFVSVLPGVYGTLDHIQPEVIDELSNKFCTDRFQIEMYTFGVKCGAHIQTPFPFWTPSFAAGAAKWLRKLEDYLLLDNLISVSDINQWFMSDNARTFWSNYKLARAKMTLSKPPANIDKLTLPTLRDLIVALILTERFGFLGWISCNRVLRVRPDSSASALLLALLVVLGVLQPTNTWQDCHRANKDIRSIRRQVQFLYISRSQDKVADTLKTLGVEKFNLRSGGWVTPYIRDFILERLRNENKI